MSIHTVLERQGRSLSTLSARMEQDGSLMALVLFAWVAMSMDQSSGPLVQADAQEPAKPPGKASKLKELLEERAAATRDLAKEISARIKNGNPRRGS